MPRPPRDQDAPLPPPAAQEEAALQWFSRCQRGLSPEEDADFQHWLAADPRHAELFIEFDGTWNLLDRVAQSTPLLPSAPSPPSRWRALLPWGTTVAAAAALAIGYFYWWRPLHYAGKTATAVGVVHAVRLPDGSSAHLNSASTLRAAFQPEERRVVLTDGEAHFQVAKDPARPFVVEAAGVLVRAVGTAFNVHLDAHHVVVLVTEGTVRVHEAASGRSVLASSTEAGSAARSNSAPPILVAGEKLVLPRSGATSPRSDPLARVSATKVSPEEIQRMLAWRQHRLEFELASLEEIVAAFNRHNPVPLVIDDPALARKRFGGSFKPDDRAGLLRMLQQNFGVVVEEHPHATVLRAGP